MTLELFGLTIYEADVALTDIALAVLGGWCAARLWRGGSAGSLQRHGAVIMAGLASAALCGALFHAFFPAKTGTPAGVLMWTPVAGSIAIAAATMLTVSARLLLPALPRALVAATAAGYVAAFMWVVLVVNDSYSSIVLFYGPVLLCFLLAALRESVQRREGGWWRLTAGLALSVVAALLQQARVAAHPVYFDHNALYHVLQGVALVLIYQGIMRAHYAVRADAEARMPAA